MPDFALLDRRRLLKLAGFGLAALALSPSRTIEAALTERALLYDIQVGAYGSREAALAAKASLSNQLRPELSDLLATEQNEGNHRVFLRTRTIADHADSIVASLQSEGVDALKRLGDFYFNPNQNDGRYARLIVEKSLQDLVVKYTTAYGTDEIRRTHQSLRTINGREPRQGEFAKVPVRWLKIPHQIGMAEGDDYVVHELQRGEALWTVAERFTTGENGDVKRNAEIIRRFNGIRPGQKGDIWPGTPIMVPQIIYKDPLAPSVVAETKHDDVFEVVRSTPPASVPEETRKQIRSALEERIPETRGIDGHLKRGPWGVLRDTEMPSVLVEAFMLRNSTQVKFYRSSDNLKRLAERYAQGVIDYALQDRTSVRKVILDNGHGLHDPGAVNRSMNAHEGEFTRKIWHHMANYIRAHSGLDVHQLDYTGRSDQVQRIRWYTREANRIGNPNDSVYVSVHVDSADDPNASPRAPEVWIYRKGTQPESTKLAKRMLARAVPPYHEEFAAFTGR